MIHMRDPGQTGAFDPFEPILSAPAMRRLREGWQGLFRHVVLGLMPAGELAKRFDPRMGRPTKELYSMAGLVLVKEFNDWTAEEAVNAYLFDAGVQYALNLEPCGQSLCERTLERYEKKFVEDDLAALAMERVTAALAGRLGLDASRQRLDSTHVFSDMAAYGRTRLMAAVVRRFLAQAGREAPEAHAAVPEELRARYGPGSAKAFRDASKEEASRRKSRQEVAEDMLFLLEQFAGDPLASQWTAYADLLRVFGEQCEVAEGKVSGKAHPGARAMQNPSDPDATRDGHKGPGCQAQIAETCAEGNETQLFTAVIPQAAADDDRDAMPEVLDSLESNGLMPEILFADTHCGSDASQQECEARGVDLQAPVPGRAPEKDPYALNADDFVFDEETGEVVSCPAGHAPAACERDEEAGETRAAMPSGACESCEFSGECPARTAAGGRRVFECADAGRRRAERRREQATEAFKENYAIRSGIEGSNSGVKRRLGFGRLRCRGRPKVFHKILLKACGWNVLRAAATGTMRRLVAEIAAKRASAALSVVFSAVCPHGSLLRGRLAALGPLKTPIPAPAGETALGIAA